MDSVFQLAMARRAKALSIQTPAKVSTKRAQKSTPVTSMTPTPTPGQKHVKLGKQASNDAALKKLSFGDESSTEAPGGLNHTGERVGMIAFLCLP